MTESERLIDDVMVRGTIGDRSFARAVVEGVLDAVAAPLGPEDRSTVARRLPGPFAAVVRRPSPDAATQPSVLCARLSHREKISLGLAFEHMKSACAAVADRLDGHGRSVLVRRLAPEWSALFILPVARAEPGRGSSTSSV